MRRVLLLDNGVWGDSYGGSLQFVRGIAHSLIREGLDVALVVAGVSGPSPEYPLGPNLPVFRYRPVRRAGVRLLPLERAAFVDGLRRAKTRLGGIDVVWAHNPLQALLYLSSPFDTPLAYTMHSPWTKEITWSGRPRALAAYPAAWAIDQLILNRSRRIHFLSRSMCADAGAVYRVPPKAVRIVPGGISSELIRPRAGQTPSNRFLTVRRLVPRMGLDHLIDACGILDAEGMSFHLDIVGEGPLYSDLEARIARLGLAQSVVLRGRLPEQDVWRLYREAGCFVIPTAGLEGFGMVLLEAMSQGVPAIATPTGGMREVLQDLPELQTVDSSPKSIAAKLRWYCGLGVAERNRLAERAVDCARRYTWDRLFPAYREMLQEAAEN